MFRWKSLTAALVAAVAVLASPAVSQAGFAVNIYLDGGATAAATVAGSGAPGNYSVFAQTTNSAGPGYVNSALIGGISFNLVSGETNNPGSSTGFVTDTTLAITNGSTAHTIRFEFVADAFTAPGQAGEQLGYNMKVTTITNGLDMLNNPLQSDLYTRVVSGAYDGRTTANNFTQVGGVFVSDQQTFVRGATYDIYSNLQYTLGADASVQTTATSTVVAPAPGGLIMAFTAVPFFGLIRRRLRKTAAPTA